MGWLKVLGRNLKVGLPPFGLSFDIFGLYHMLHFDHSYRSHVFLIACKRLIKNAMVRPNM